MTQNETSPGVDDDRAPLARGEARELTDRQLLALPFIAASSTQTEAAEAAEISRATLARWRHNPRFKDELRRTREDAAKLAHAELDGLALKSVSALANLMDDPNPRVRAQAIRTALDISLKVQEQTRIRRNLRQLENAFNHLKNQK